MSKFIDRIILIANILAATGLMLSYVAPLVNPSKLTFPALFGLAYPYLLIANLLFLGYWLIRLKKEILISFVVILLGWNHLNNMLPFRFKNTVKPADAPGSRIFKVLSYNVRGFDIYNWSQDPASKAGIFRFVRQQQPDVVCFQEYYTSSRPGETHEDISAALRSLPSTAAYFLSDRSNRSGFGIATFSRYPIVKRSRIPFNSPGNAAMYTDILMLGDTVRVFNIHLQSIRFRQEDYAFMDTVRLKYSNEQMRGIRQIGSQIKKAFARRAEQADMIANYISDTPYPVVVMGDFNDTPQSYAYRRIRKGLHDAFRKAGRGFGNTYAGELPSFRIDHILYSDPMRPFQFKRIKAPYSDHFPITTWFYLPEQASAE